MDLSVLKHAAIQVDSLLDKLGVQHQVKGEAAVFFDIDGTVNRNDCLELLIAEFIRKDLVVDKDKEFLFKKSRHLWKSRELSFEDYLKNVINLIGCLKFFPENLFRKMSRNIIKTHGSYYYIFSWLFLLKLKALGYKLVAISGAPSFMAKLYLDEVGLFPWKIHASKYIFKDHVFTGNVDLCILKNKGEFIQKKYGNLFNLQKSIALGDTMSDIAMFKKVGKAIAMNPTYELAAEAKKNKWPIVVERKNLILIFPSGQCDIA